MDETRKILEQVAATSAQANAEFIALSRTRMPQMQEALSEILDMCDSAEVFGMGTLTVGEIREAISARLEAEV